MTCAMHVTDSHEKITVFSGVSWQKFISCAREWCKLSGREKDVATEAIQR